MLDHQERHGHSDSIDQRQRKHPTTVPFGRLIGSQRILFIKKSQKNHKEQAGLWVAVSFRGLRLPLVAEKETLEFAESAASICAKISPEHWITFFGSGDVSHSTEIELFVEPRI